MTKPLTKNKVSKILNNAADYWLLSDPTSYKFPITYSIFVNLVRFSYSSEN